MDMKRKIAALLMAAIMVLMVLTGCAKGGVAGDEGSQGETAGNETEERASADEDVLDSKTVDYTDGHGTMQFTDDLTFTWQDDKENAGEDMVFKYAS